MPATIRAFDEMIDEAVRHFWRARTEAAENQRERGAADQGNRGGVTAGKNLDVFIDMVRQLIVDNGIADAEVYTKGKAMLTIPGFYRPTKNWDLIVARKNSLIAAIEFKSQVGPSFGNNFNNRVEEALGNAADLNTAFRKGAFGNSQKPFVGYLFILEKCDKSMSPVRFSSPHFPALPEFKNTSYAARYEILCRKLVLEQLYEAAGLILTEKAAIDTGAWEAVSEMTDPRRFAAVLAGKIAGMALA